ncbi:cystine/glutamate transporter-like [Anneissia japonica]|uniref:cystine/glutamate transporter-like n=1 Tax=Anneissia japonica TaxID=1529436 RepID=UPI0014257DBD|nr:cystine/glutamate transporter-like [Anneissia japonica]
MPCVRMRRSDSIATVSSDSSDDSSLVILLRHVNMTVSISLIVGTIIGSGIFVSPKEILEYTGTIGMSLVVWIVCGIFSTIGALCYAELGTTFSKSGGDYTYLLEAFGPLVAFLRVWTSIVAVRTGSWAIISVTFARYLTEPFLHNCDEEPVIAVRLLSAAILFVIFFVNSVSVPLSTRLQIFLCIVKIVGLFLIIIVGAYHFINGPTDPSKPGKFDRPFESHNSEFNWQKLPNAFFNVLFAYSGWQFYVQTTEEIRNPNRYIMPNYWTHIQSQYRIQDEKEWLLSSYDCYETASSNWSRYDKRLSSCTNYSEGMPV